MFRKCDRRPFKAMCVLLVLTHSVTMVLAAPLPIVSVVSVSPTGSSEETAPQVTANTTAPESGSLTPVVMIPDPPSDADLLRVRVFSEPLTPIGGPTSEAENDALGDALRAYLAAPGEQSVGQIRSFLNAYPRSAWRASLLANLGLLYRRTGYFTRALAAWDEAWLLARDETEANAAAVGDLIVGELSDLNARLGRFDRLEELFAETAGRDVRGSAAEKVSGARQGLWRMRSRPEEAFLCGPMALDRILLSTRAGYAGDERIAAAQSTQRGTSLAQMHALAGEVGLNLQMAQRSAGTAFLLPAMVHWKAGHFAALVGEQGGRYRLQDPTFGDEMWVSRQALEDETSGYFLVPSGRLPTGWRPVSLDEGGRVWGKGAASGFAPGQNGPNQPKVHPPQCPPMAVYNFHELIVSLNITDTPVRYEPPRGPSMGFGLTYNQREAFQPQIFYYSNLGPKWTFDWVSYLEDDPANAAADVALFLRGGGREVYSGYNAQTSSYQPALNSRATVVRTATSPIRYERRLPDGSVEVFAQSDGGGAAPRRVFMTQVVDAQGNAVTLTYDPSLRLVGLTDAIGQVTTLSYEDPANPLRITKVTDPFGRFATFAYNPSGRLMRITDVIGITSEFTYGAADFITSLTTPYGTTTFEMGESGLDRWLEAVDPLGGRERLEYVNATNELPYSDPAAIVPTGFADHNARLGQSVTLHWDKRGINYYPDRSKAKQTAWLRTWPANLATEPKRSEKLPLENRVWFSYPGQTHWLYVMTGMYSVTPAKLARVLDDGQSQIYSYEYNLLGKTTRETDPLGRETTYEYDTNQIDLLRIKQKNPASAGGYDLLETRTYNSLHEPLTITDAASQTTTLTYNTAGQMLTMTTPLRSCSGCGTENRTTTWSYDASGYLQSVTRPAMGAAKSVTYDGYGRLRTVTDEDSYTLTYDYDALNRPTRTTYPDTTYEEVVYNRLDPEKHRDRLGRWTHRVHDALRRVVSTRDPAGRTVTQQWCTCGSLDKLIDPNGNATFWDRDLQGRMTKETGADSSFSEYVYETTTSRLKKQKDAKGQERHYTYFIDDSVQHLSYPNAQIATPSVSYIYESAYPRVATMVDGMGSTSYAYHPVTATPALGATLLASVDGPFSNDAVTYAYDELGRVATRTLNGVMTTWSYDGLDRLTTLGDPIGTFTPAYVGTTKRVSSMTYPNGQITTYAYLPNSGDRHLQEIHHRVSTGGATLSKLSYGYDAVGNITLWTQQYGASTANAYDLNYDGADQLTSATYRTTDPTPVTLKRYGYVYDPSGNRMTEQIDDAPTLSSYDNRNRLTEQQPGGALTFKGTLNEAATVTLAAKPATVGSDNKFHGSAQVGSSTSNVAVAATDSSGNMRTNTYQVNVAGSTRSFTYDANGSLTVAATKTYEWDGANRLLRVLDNAAEVARFVYDGQGRRAQKIAGGVTRTYIYDGEDILEDRPSNGATLRYVHGTGVDQPIASVESGEVAYLLADHLGSILQTTNASTSVTLTRQYDTWGNLLQGSGTGGYAFTGREWDAEAGLYYYRARYYDPVVGRFLSADPVTIGGARSIAEPTVYPYVYVHNRPTNLADPSGLAATSTVYDGCVLDAQAALAECSKRARAAESRAMSACMEEWKYCTFWLGDRVCFPYGQCLKRANRMKDDLLGDCWQQYNFDVDDCNRRDQLPQQPPHSSPPPIQC